MQFFLVLLNQIGYSLLMSSLFLLTLEQRFQSGHSTLFIAQVLSLGRYEIRGCGSGRQKDGRSKNLSYIQTIFPQSTLLQFLRFEVFAASMIF